MFFSVNKPIKIAETPYIPCVCYECNIFLEPTVKKLETEGIVTIYTQKVAFCDGKIIEKKKADKTVKVEDAPLKEEKKEDPKEKNIKGF